MDNEVGYLIGGLYTVVYLVVFFIQKSQIKKQQAAIDSQKTAIESIKEVSGTMERYMNIFRIDEIEKYVALKEKLFRTHAELFVKESVENKQEIKDFMKKYLEQDEHYQSAAKKVMLENFDEFDKIYQQKYNPMIKELSSFAFFIIKQIPDIDKEKYIIDNFPENKDFLLQLMSVSRKDELEQAK
jgi:hypothetical protein